MKILVTLPENIESTVSALHALKQIREQIPESEVYLLGGNGPLSKACSIVRRHLQRSDDLDIFSFDVGIDLENKPENSRLFLSLNIPVRVSGHRDFSRWFFNRSCSVPPGYFSLPLAESYWKIVSQIDYSMWNSALESSAGPEDFPDLQPYHSEKKRFILAPGSNSHFSEGDWIELARYLRRDNPGLDIHILLESSTDPTTDQVLEINLESESGILFHRNLSAPFTIGMLHGSHGYIGASIPTSHLASLMGVTGIALYPPGPPSETWPHVPYRSSLRTLTVRPKTKIPDIISALNDELTSMESLYSREPISAFVICKNEEANIARCLKSLSFCDEIVVVDSGSTDNTLSIAAKFTDKVITNSWSGFTKQKQFALEQCSHEWVLNIDSDEEVSSELRQEILEVLVKEKKKRSNVVGYRLLRVVHFLGRWWEKGGWYPEYRMRLIKRSKTRWGGIDPHEKAIVSGKTKRLRGKLHHFTYKDLSDQIDRINRYTTNISGELWEQGERASFFKLIFNPPARFVKFYLIKKGFLEGRVGFLVAKTEAFYAFIKYAKLWELGIGEHKTGHLSKKKGLLLAFPTFSRKNAKK